MKKLLLLLLSLTLLLVGCADTAEEPNNEATVEANEEEPTVVEEQDAEEEEKEAKTEYGLGEEWVVDDVFKLTVDSVKATDERNQYAENEDPAEVVVITYSYENLGYEGDIQDLFITPDRVIDGDKKVTETYPAGSDKYAQPTPVGAIMEGAQESYALTTESEEIKVMFSVYDEDYNEHKATFVVPVEK